MCVCVSPLVVAAATRYISARDDVGLLVFLPYLFAKPPLEKMIAFAVVSELVIRRTLCHKETKKQRQKAFTDMNEDLYAALNLEQGARATTDEIRSAFARQLDDLFCLQSADAAETMVAQPGGRAAPLSDSEPELAGASSAQQQQQQQPRQRYQRYREVLRAFRILSCDRWKRTYDAYGYDGLCARLSDAEASELGAQVSDVRPVQHRAGDIHRSVRVTLEELHAGADKTLTVRRSIVCPACSGFGSRDGTPPPVCADCDGESFTVQYSQLDASHVRERVSLCARCLGVGLALAGAACTRCLGTAIVWQDKTVHVQLTKCSQASSTSTRDGYKLVCVFCGEGNAQPGMVTGDLIVGLHVEPHPVFDLRPATRPHTKVADDSLGSAVSHWQLHTIVDLSLHEWLHGFQRTLTDLNARPLILACGSAVKDDEKNAHSAVQATCLQIDRRLRQPGDTVLFPGHGLRGGELCVELQLRFSPDRHELF